MGITSWLFDIGMQLEDVGARIATRTGEMPLQWQPGKGGVIHRLSRDPHQRASLFSTTQTIVVNEGEAAVVLQDGKAKGALEPGRYVFTKARVVGALDIVWIRTGQQTVKWGVGPVLSSDGVVIGANGVAFVRIADAQSFNAEVVQGALAMGEQDLQRVLVPRLQGTLRTLIAKWAALDIQAQRDAFVQSVRENLAQPLATLGLSIVEFEVTEVSLPPELKAAMSHAVVAQHSGRAAVIEAQARAQVTQISSIAEAQAQLNSGMAQVQLVAQLQAQGIDPMRFKALEALQTYAENPGAAGGALGDIGRAQLMGQLAVAALAPAPTNNVAMQQVPNILAAAPAQLPAASQTPTQGAAPQDQLASFERQLDDLVERLSEGKISEETFGKLSARLEAKIAALKGST